jgi:thiamine transport system ATP-binding protein
LLLLDEPLGALDRHLRERLVAEIGALCRTLGQSVLFVTHDHDEAFGLGDRVAILHRGRVEQIGEPGDVWSRPATAFAAEFLGWNVVDAGGAGLEDALGHRGRVAVRPDALALAPHGPLAGVAVARTFRRDHWIVRVELQPSPGAHGSALDVVVRDPRPPGARELVHVLVHPDGVVPLQA